jgi:hypothetical protein
MVQLRESEPAGAVLKDGTVELDPLSVLKTQRESTQIKFNKFWVFCNPTPILEPPRPAKSDLVGKMDLADARIDPCYLLD